MNVVAHTDHSRYYRVLRISLLKLLLYADAILEEHDRSVFVYGRSNLFVSRWIRDYSFIGADDVGEASIYRFICGGDD